METLFGEIRATGLVNLEDVDSLQGASPKTWIWLRRLFFNGELELVAQALLEANLIQKGSEAPAFLLREVVENHVAKTHAVSFGDLQRLTHVGLRSFLRDHLGLGSESDEPSELVLYRTLGRISHRFAEWLYQANLQVVRPKQGGLFGESVEQMALFDLGAQVPRLESSISNRLFEQSLIDLKKSNRTRFEFDFVRRLRRERRDVKPALGSFDAYAQNYFSVAKRIQSFREMIGDNFPEQAEMIRRLGDGPLLEALSLFTVAGWVSLLERRLGTDYEVAALTEIPVLPRSFEVWAGRIDRLDIISKNPRDFRGLQRKHLHSALEFIERTWALRHDLRFEVVDYKFAVGDNRDHLIDSSQVLPLKNHVDQVQWYLLWLALGHALATGGDGHELPNGEMFTGKLVYILPNGKLVDISVSSPQEELKVRFKEQVVYHWAAICGKRDHRLLNNATRGVLKAQIANGNGEHGGGNGKTVPLAATQEVFSELRFDPRPIATLVDSFHKFVGTASVIEEVDLGSSVRYRMHLGRLHAAIQRGEIQARQNFSWERGGGFICCLLHQEKSPSLHLAFERGIWKCFGCGASGTFAREDLPSDVANLIPAEHLAARRLSSASAGLEVPEWTRKIMRRTQDIFSESFVGSSAREYAILRKIDPDLVAEYGAGCGIDPRRGYRVLDILLEEGWTVRQIAECGLLSYSESGNSGRQVPCLLRRHGIPESEIVRKEMLRSGRETTAWPFFSLTGWLTFPLELPLGSESVVTGFYGRHVPTDRFGTVLRKRVELYRPNDSMNQRKPLDHLVVTPKTVINGQTVPKGMFNGREIAIWLAEGGLEKVFVTKAVIDALVLRMMGYGPAVGIIGTGTNHLEQLLASFQPSEIQIALDFDSAGIEGTERLRKSFLRAGFKGEVGDFAGIFADQHAEEIGPEGSICSDFGDWWEKFGFHQRHKP